MQPRTLALLAVAVGLAAVLLVHVYLAPWVDQQQLGSARHTSLAVPALR